MPSTLNLQSTISWCGPYINFLPMNIGGSDPALTIANLVVQTVMGAPFAWRWNRGEASFVCAKTTPPTTDYVKFLNDFGYIEKAWVSAADNSDRKELTVRTSVAITAQASRPEFISVLLDDNAGNLTFRLLNGPDDVYPVNVQYQKKPQLLTSMASPWPIPDELGYIYQFGFLALACYLNRDERAPIFSRMFTAHLLGAQEGLDDLQRNIFLGNWLEITKQLERAQMKTQQGIAGRQQ